MRSHALARRWLAPLIAIVTMLALVLLLASVSYFSPAVVNAASQDTTLRKVSGTAVFINELHYDNASSDQEEGIEVAGPAGTDLTGWQLVAYNGNGGASYNDTALNGTLPDQQNGRGTLFFAISGLQNGAPDGVALVDASNTVIQFLSYEGSFTATDGPANGMMSSDIGVSEASSTPEGYALQLSGTGCMYEEFIWNAPAANTYNAVNTGQTFLADCGTSAAEPDLTISKDAPETGMASERIMYTIDVDNIGAADADDVMITDTLPTGVSFVTYTSSSPLTFTNNAPVLVWQAGTVTTDTELMISLTVDLPTSFTATITNTVEITTSTAGDSAANNSAQAVTSPVMDGSPDENAPELLLTEILVTPTEGQFIEIHNPTTGTIDLTDLYLTDATYQPGGTFYYNIVTGSNAGGGGFSDFHARFPNGASIPAGGYQTIAIAGSADFVAQYDMPPTYELYDDSSNDGEQLMLEAFAGSINNQGGLSNGDEVIILYYWDGSSDLVTDIDYVVWGDKEEGVDKTGVVLDGSDADSILTAYRDDTALAFQEAVSDDAHDLGNSWQREDLTEGAEVMSDGNGVGGDDETSEDVSNTWCEALPSPGQISPCAGPDILSVEKNGPAEATPSDTITYSIDVANVGHVSAENVLIIDTLPDDVTYVSHSSSTPLTFTNNAPSLQWEAGTMTNDSELTISLTVQIHADFSAPLINTVVVSSTTSGDDLDNNRDEAVTTLPTGGACGDPFTAIYDIQGNGASSPLPNGTFVTTEGVVVGDFQDGDQLNGFFLQDATGDGDMATSDGIFVYAPDSADVAEGDIIRLTGEVSEFFALTELTNSSNMLNCGTGNATPATLTLPVDDITDFEPYEGMLINIAQELSVSEHYNLGRYGQVTLSQGGRLSQPTNVTTPGAAANALQEANNKRRIILDDGSTQQNPDPIIHPGPELSAINTLRGGDSVSNLTGILNYRADEYRVEPTGPISFTHANPRPTTPPAVGGSLKVASFNVLNYFTTIDNGSPICGPAGDQGCRGADSASEFTRQRDKIITAILDIDADIIGLMEIENNANAAIQDLVDGLNAVAGAGTYDYIDTGTIGSDAIKVAMIYKAATVTAVGDFGILDSTVDVEPPFNDNKNRPVLAQTFQQNSNSEKVTVAVNHLKSKGSACDDVDDPNTGDGQGNCNQTRTNAATALANWLATDPTGSGDSDFLIIGDLNAYAMEDPITALKNAGYSNLLEQDANAYTYVFDGQWGYLDHALSSASLTPQVTGAAVWHINADEPRSLDYNEEFQSAGQVISLYNNDRYRASDHDPVLIGLNLSPPSTYGVELSGHQAQSAAIGGSIIYALTISNTGNSTDTFTLSATGNWTTTVSPLSITMQPAESRQVQVQVDIPASATANESQGSVVSATSSGDNRISDSANLTTTALPDDDADGISNETEAGAPNNGDGNGDGIPDNEQENVASVPNQGSSDNQGYVTLAAPPGVEVVDVVAIPAPDELPEGVAYMPQGMFEFDLNGLTSSSVLMTLTLHAGDTVPDTYYKHDENSNTWYEFLYDGTTGAIINTDDNGKTIITLHFVDGGRGDADGTVNGVIDDPGAPGMRTADPTSVELTTLDGQTAPDWPLALLATVGLALGLAFWYRRRK